MKIKKCIQCNKKYETKSTLSKYCSESCSNKYKYRNKGSNTHMCKNCNTKFRTVRKKAEYCSKACKGLHENTYVRDKETILQQITECLLDLDRYATNTEVLELCKLSTKTVTKHNISIATIAKTLGYNAPVSNFEERDYEQLKHIYPTYTITRQKTFNTLVSPNKIKLKVDFYIEELHIAIEADGPQHYIKNQRFYSENATVRTY